MSLFLTSPNCTATQTLTDVPRAPGSAADPTASTTNLCSMTTGTVIPALASPNHLSPQNTLFTVEQLMLIRRLRSTGISAEAVLQGFQTLDQIENDLDSSRLQSLALASLMNPAKLFNIDAPTSTTFSPTALEMAAPSLAGAPVVSAFFPSNNGNNNNRFSQSPNLMEQLRQTLATPNGALPHTQLKHQSSESARLSPKTFTTVPMASSAAADVSMFNGFLPGASKPQNATSPSTSSLSAMRPIRSQRTPMKEITTLDDPSELEEFMAQGEEGCINDMKQFITQFSLRQTTVAMMTGVSQPYISKLLNGNHRELSLRCRKNIYSWYLNCRRHPEKLAAFLQDPSTRLETNGDGELVPQRRERYVFRPILIKILETFFIDTPFPDFNKRIEIAAACNNALQFDKKGVGLLPKEIVSPQVVANWFANKRKEMRRRSTEDSASRHSQQQSEGDEVGTPSPINGIPESVPSACSQIESESGGGGGGEFFGSFSKSLKEAFAPLHNEHRTIGAMVDANAVLHTHNASRPHFVPGQQNKLLSDLIEAYQLQRDGQKLVSLIKMEQTAK